MSLFQSSQFLHKVKAVEVKTDFAWDTPHGPCYIEKYIWNTSFTLTRNFCSHWVDAASIGFVYAMLHKQYIALVRMLVVKKHRVVSAKWAVVLHAELMRIRCFVMWRNFNEIQNDTTAASDIPCCLLYRALKMRTIPIEHNIVHSHQWVWQKPDQNFPK